MPMQRGRFYLVSPETHREDGPAANDTPALRTLDHVEQQDLLATPPPVGSQK